MSPSEFSEFKKLATRLAWFASPLLFLCVTYVMLDPFQVLYPRDYFYKHCHVEPDRDYVTTEVFLKNSRTIPYDSFIFGNSRSLAFRASEWIKHIDARASYHYDASDESLYGVWAKFKFLDSREQTMRNVLWIVDAELLEQIGETPKEKSHLSLKHPALTGMSWSQFHTIEFGAYFQRLFFLKYLDYRLFGEYRRYMGDVISEDVIKFDHVHNDQVRNPRGESEVNPEKYYGEKMKDVFYEREEGMEPVEAVVGEKQRNFLKQIRDVLGKRQSRYKIVISPLYHQRAFNPKDLTIFQEIFGADNVYDFSGVNEFTSDVRNYFETSHYKPRVADEIMRRIYADPG